VEHERLEGFTAERLDFLLIGGGAEGNDGEHLGLSPAKHCRPMGARQNPHLDGDGTNLVKAAAVDAALLHDHHAADRFLFEILERSFDFLAAFRKLAGNLLDHSQLECFLQITAPQLFGRGCHLAHFVGCGFLHGGDQQRILDDFRRGFLDRPHHSPQFILGIENGQDGAMSGIDGFHQVLF